MCSECGMKFTTNQTLKKHHQVVHDGIKEFKCDKCFKEYGEKADLRRHIESGEFLSNKSIHRSCHLSAKFLQLSAFFTN